jgi:hypothetical protein
VAQAAPNGEVPPVLAVAGSSTRSDDCAVERALEWLLASPEPAIAYLTRRDLLGEEVEPPDEILEGPIVRALLDADLDLHPYQKWRGAHWRLVSLVELGVRSGEERALAGVEQVLGWLTGASHRSRIQTIDGLVRRCASQEGNALAVCCWLGLAEDERVQLLAESLIEWQWPDGGWNCDKRATGRRSSFNESLPPMWGLHEYFQATGDAAARDAARRTAELLLEHHLFRALQTGEVIKPAWLVPHYPPYWHYEAPQALLILSRMGLARDPRAAEAIDALLSRGRADGTWRAGTRWWRPPGRADANVEAVDWGPTVPHQMVTLNALRILQSAARSSRSPERGLSHVDDHVQDRPVEVLGEALG